MRNYSYTDIILMLRPEAIFTIHNNEYDTLMWLDEVQSKPSEEEINQELNRLQKLYEHNEYQRNRASEYPSYADQFDLLYHGGFDAWKAKIDEVKNKYPKVTDAN